MRVARFATSGSTPRYGIVDGEELVVLASDPIFVGFETTGERVPLADVRELKEAYGCTVNDIVLGLCAGTLRSYLLDHDALPESARHIDDVLAKARAQDEAVAAASAGATYAGEADPYRKPKDEDEDELDEDDGSE